MKKYIKNKILAEITEWLIAIAGMAAIFFICQSFIFRNAVVSGPSMEPTLFHGERLIILKLPYLFGNPKVNDIIAFPYKENPSQHFVKRVVGLPGDVIDIRERVLYINGEEFYDEYTSGLLISVGDTSFPITVPDNSYFVLGDNRDQSNDSRFMRVGCIRKDEMMGRVSVRYWPLSKFGPVR